MLLKLNLFWKKLRSRFKILNKINIQGPFIILSGPSGVGKTLFLERTLKEYPHFENTVTYTTRSPRNQEKPGNHYHFIDLKEFKKLDAEGRFMETAKVHNEWYGTPYDEVYRIWKNKKSVIKDLDVQGAKSIKKIYPHAITIFIYPPNMEELKKRLINRGFKGVNDLEERFTSAEREMAEGRIYDFKIINDVFEEAWEEFKKIIDKSKIL